MSPSVALKIITLWAYGPDVPREHIGGARLLTTDSTPWFVDTKQRKPRHTNIEESEEDDGHSSHPPCERSICRQSFSPPVLHLEDGISSQEAAAHVGGEGRSMFSSCSLEAADMLCLTIVNTPRTSRQILGRSLTIVNTPGTSRQILGRTCVLVYRAAQWVGYPCYLRRCEGTEAVGTHRCMGRSSPTAIALTTYIATTPAARVSTYVQ